MVQYQIGPDGLPVLMGPNGPGLPLPLSEEQMQAAGAQLAPPPGVTPGANPYAGLPGAVAGPGGGEQFLGGGKKYDQFGNEITAPPQAPAFAGLFSGAKPGTNPNALGGGAHYDQFGNQTSPPPVIPSHPHEAPPAADAAPPKKAVKLADPKVDKTTSDAGEQPALDPLLAEVFKGSGGGGKPGLRVTSEERKSRELGPVDPTLAAAVQAGQADVDASEWSQVQAHAQRQDDLAAAQFAAAQKRNDEIQADRVRRQAVNDQLQQLASVRNQREEEAASMKAPDVADYWKDKSMGSRIATAIALIAGGALQGLRGGSNPGMDALNSSIDRWVASQKEEYERARGQVSAADNHYKQALEIYGSPEQAEADLRIRASAVADSQLQVMAQKIGTQDALANAQVAIKQNQLQRKQLAAQAQQAAGAEVTEKLAMNYGGAGGNTLGKRLEETAKAKKNLDIIRGVNPKAPNTAVMGPDGQVLGYAKTVEDSIKTQKQVQAGDAVQKSVDEIQRLTEDAASRAPGTPERAAAEVKLGALAFQLHEQLGIAGFRGPTMDMLHNMVGDPGAFIRAPNSGAQLGAIKQFSRANTENIRKFLTARPGSGGGSGSESAAPAPAESEESVEE